MPLLVSALFRLGLFFLLAIGLRAASAEPLPPATTLAEQDDFAISTGAEWLRIGPAEAAAPGGVAAWRVATAEGAKDPWTAQLRAELREPVKRGDRGLLIVQARAVETSHESDQARMRLVVANRGKPFPRVAVGQFSVDREWREYALPFAFERDFAPGEAVVTLDLGFGRQAIEIAGLGLLNYGASVALERLPRTRVTYAGHEPEAVWRREALARIERIRKGDLSVEVADAAGKPLPGAEVRVTLRNHAFQFGTAVNVEAFTAPGPDAEAYRRHILDLFNAGTLENALKWTNWAGDGKSADYRQRTFKTLDWMKSNGLAVRGHVMVWPGKRFLPEYIKRLLDTPGEKRVPELTLEHIRDIALATKDHVSEWDVLNEPVGNRELMDRFGREIMGDWFKAARAALPATPLFLNDWGNHDERSSLSHLLEFESVARELLQQGAPLDGLGLQCHIGGVPSAPADLLSTLDRYQRNFNLPIRVTEFDVSMDDEEVQASYTRDFMIVMFSHPSVIGVQHWGFWAGRHWEPKAALYRKDWSEKPNGAAYRKLVKETWHTDASGRTDEAGRWTTRGFHGDYEVTVNSGGRSHTVTLRHDAGATAPHRVALP